MALEYQLMFSTDSSVTSLLEAVPPRFGLVWSADHTFLAGTGVQVSSIASSRSRQGTIEEGFGFRPEAQLFFRMASDPEARRVGYRTMIEVVVEVLRQESGQAVLLFNGEIILLQRLAEGLMLNGDWQPWQNESLDLITLPYRMQSLPSPLL